MPPSGVPPATPAPLTATQLALLRTIHEADRDHGGLFRDELTEDEADECFALAERGLAEVVSEYGEAPDGEEDERDAGEGYRFRITGTGVARLRDAPEPS